MKNNFIFIIYIEIHRYRSYENFTNRIESASWNFALLGPANAPSLLIVVPVFFAILQAHLRKPKKMGVKHSADSSA
jgi:hypothetical protein